IRQAVDTSTAQHQVMPDDHSELVPLLPIPNRTVKQLRADDSAGSRVKVGHRQALTALKTPSRQLAGVFSWGGRKCGSPHSHNRCCDKRTQCTPCHSSASSRNASFTRSWQTDHWCLSSALGRLIDNSGSTNHLTRKPFRLSPDHLQIPLTHPDGIRPRTRLASTALSR